MKVFNCILGVFSVFAAFYCICYPGLTFLNSGWIVTMLLGVIGFCSIFEYFSNKENKKLVANGVIGLVLGIIAAVLSIIAMFSIITRVYFDIAVLVLFALWLIYSGMGSIVTAVKIKKSGEKYWWLTLILGILIILTGLYSATHLLVTALSLGTVMGIALMIYGFRLIMSVFEK